ncbi:CPBP family glutamic-type intramembrane protease [Halomonas ramblicola]|uniref:CPBP family glutamic-type intramembrane protease n=1 Tax=Halomonas ramblicola TaxID=747349 RepID=UPI0025B40FFC|nr:CPBP family glutamic-type intramembrane protease [Halomonas ramblicola]MDN3520195.1 CPBP family glutamic-type intramembrane protease [Halomonas ramblicola]
MKGYLQENLVEGFRKSPFRAPLKAWALVPFYAVISLTVGLNSGLLRFELISAELVFLLPLTLFIFPALLEEAFFRGVLIPRQIIERGRWQVVIAIAWSTLLFVLWHPLNAVTFNSSAMPTFLDPAFLLIVAILGVTCGYGYVVSKSIWVPVLIHWATVVVWVFFLGGRNLVLEL